MRTGARLKTVIEWTDLIRHGYVGTLALPTKLSGSRTSGARRRQPERSTIASVCAVCCVWLAPAQRNDQNVR
jgi:hypothetical protein